MRLFAPFFSAVAVLAVSGLVAPSRGVAQTADAGAPPKASFQGTTTGDVPNGKKEVTPKGSFQTTETRPAVGTPGTTPQTSFQTTETRRGSSGRADAGANP
jgi:hypothetical protein